MCGICGALGGYIHGTQLRKATDLMFHRGPDESGYYQDSEVALGMRRLSIIDLAGGAQPKTNENGTLQVIFNGEIYNFRELQDELRSLGHVFESRSDTEVIAHAYEEWGTDSFARLNGIFAIAIWDTASRQLVLVRDHLGVKPLYFARMGDIFAFASELKPLLSLLPEIPPLDVESVTLFLRYQYVPAPRSIFRGVNKLSPAHYAIVCPGDLQPCIRRYWDPVASSNVKQSAISIQDAEDLVDDALAKAVKRQLVSDVPLGAFLSGGVDSSTVVAMMQQGSNGRTKTFSIGFHDPDTDESGYASQVAEHLGTDHYSWIISEADALDVVPRLPQYFDEPFADASAIPTYLVSQMARQHVTVSLSGDGGDELFGGYDRYARMNRIQQWWKVPQQLRRVGVATGVHLPGRVGKMVRVTRSVTGAASRSDAYRNLVAVNHDAWLGDLTGVGTAAWRTNDEWPQDHFVDRNLSEAMMLTDLVTYLPDDILTKVDRASMAHSLEARVPLLDPWFVELVLTLPTTTRLSTGPKALLKSVLKRYVPAHLVDRPKHGFGIPIHEWLRNDLRSCMEEYLAPDSLSEHGLFEPEAVARLVRSHLSGTANYGYGLWALLMFQMWYHHFYRELAYSDVVLP